MESIKYRNALVLGFIPSCIRMKIQLFCIVALAAHNIRRSVSFRRNPQKHDVVIHLMKKRRAEKKQANDNDNYKTAWEGLEYTAMKQQKTDTLTC